MGSLVTRSFRGSRFLGAHQTLGTGFVAQASFVATTPTFILDAGSTRALVIARITASQLTAGGADVNMVFATDLINRYASGGAAVTPVDTDRSANVTPTASLYGVEPTAAAAGANVHYFGQRLVDNVIDLPGVIDFPDGIVIPASGSFLGYFYCGTSDAKLALTIEWIEA